MVLSVNQWEVVCLTIKRENRYQFSDCALKTKLVQDILAIYLIFSDKDLHHYMY